eukprot:877659-Prymnesium_polylepis.1
MVDMLKSGRLSPEKDDIQAMLTIATCEGWNDALSFMIDSMGYDPSDFGQTEKDPLAYAAENGHYSTVVMMVDKYGADVN